PSRRICAWWRLGPRPTARSSRPRTTTRSSASSRRLGSSAGPASSRSHTARTPPARWRGRSPTRRSSSRRLRNATPTIPRPRRAVPTEFVLDAPALHGARLGVVRNRLFGYSPAADAIADAAIAEMKKQGAVIVDPANIPTLGKFDDSEFDVLLYEFKADLTKYLTWLGPASPVHTLADIITFDEEHKDREMPYFDQEIMKQAQKKGPLTDPKYKAELAKNHRLSRTLGIDAVMTKYKLDALVAPTGGPAWLTDLVNGDGGTAVAPGPSTVTSVAGYPHVTVPAGYFPGLP